MGKLKAAFKGVREVVMVMPAAAAEGPEIPLLWEPLPACTVV